MTEEQGQIRSIEITGDFFLVPEESLGKLEKMLEDVPLREAELSGCRRNRQERVRL